MFSKQSNLQRNAAVKTIVLLKAFIRDKICLKQYLKIMISSDTGFLQMGNFSAAKIIAYIVFGAIGFVAFVYGKKNALLRPLFIGLALMVYPYFISGTLVVYLVGIVLTAVLYFWRE